MTRKKVRDIYGNWVYQDDDEKHKKDSLNTPNSDHPTFENEREEQHKVKLEWRDWIALVVASLETVLLPIIIFIIVVFILAILILHF
jgi:hypothetical protein